MGGNIVEALARIVIFLVIVLLIELIAGGVIIGMLMNTLFGG